MRIYKAIFWVEVEGIDKGDAEKSAKEFIKKNKLKANLIKIEE